jgi:guanylate kinase
MKQIILAVVGESGVGKSTVAQEFNKYGFKEVESYTNRPKRTKNETGHTFLSEDDFKKLNKSDMIAYTKYGDYEYCALESDLQHKNAYVIDERGLNDLLKLKDKFHVLSLRIYRANVKVDKKRKERNLEEYKRTPEQFNYVLYNNGTLQELSKQIDYLWVNFIRPDLSLLKNK